MLTAMQHPEALSQGGGSVMKKILTQSALTLLLAAAGALSVTSAASAAPRVYQGGIYHQEVLPNGTVTGPLGPEVNGG
jgi:hypothetical protein